MNTSGIFITYHTKNKCYDSFDDYLGCDCKEKTGTINLLNGELDTLKELKEGLEEVEKLIDSGLDGLAAGFPEWLEEEYD